MALLIREGIIITPEGPDIRAERGTIVVEDDRIVRVAYNAKAGEIEPGPFDRVIEATDRLIIPGLVDAHSHFYGTLAPALIDYLPLEIREPLLGAMTRGWGERETRATTLLGALRMMRNGTTTVLENVLHGMENTESTISALVDSGMRAMVGPAIADRPFHETMPGYLECLPELHRSQSRAPSIPNPKDLLESCLDVVRRWHGAEGRIYICLSPSAPHRCTDELMTMIAEAAGTHELAIHTHLLETRVQTAIARRLYGRTMVEHIWTLGLLRPGFCGAHSVWLTDREIELMAEARAGISHNPLSNLYLGDGIARVPEMLRHGVAVGIGSDGPNCGSTMSLFEVMKLAALVHRINETDARQWVGARDAFRMATLDGARALALDSEIGSIEAGKKADLVLLNGDAGNFVPLNDPVAQIVYGETGSAVETVVVNGEVILEGGSPTRFKAAEVLAEAREIGPHVKEQAKLGLARARKLEPYLRKAYFALLRESDV
jgi:cytosine/adenosine deaminase-related metal-dependent hydrolase